MVYINVLLNRWNNAFYNALQDKNYAVFVRQIIRFSWLAIAYIVVAVYQLYLNQMLLIRWRRWLTERYLRGWLTDRAYYRMQLAGGETDNPDQRIADDVRLFISGSLGLAIGGLRAAVTLASVVAILWSLSGPLHVSLGGISISVPGYLVWAALLYAVVGTWLTNRVGRPLVQLNFDQQRYEADFRFGLVRFRENTEGVALYGGGRGTARVPGAVHQRDAQLVGNHAPAETAHVVDGQLCPGGGRLSVPRRGPALLPG
jgi:putative ATP-binding cassette transporter